MVELLRHGLAMPGRRTLIPDAGGGLATRMAKEARPQDPLFAASFRFPSAEAVSIVRETAARGVPIVAIRDGTLSPLAKSAPALSAIPEHEYSFSRSLAAPMCRLWR